VKRAIPDHEAKADRLELENGSQARHHTIVEIFEVLTSIEDVEIIAV